MSTFLFSSPLSILLIRQFYVRIEIAHSEIRTPILLMGILKTFRF